MGFFNRLFGTSKSEASQKYEHPSLGDFYLEKGVGWLNENAAVPGFGEGFSVYLTGDADGPSKDSIQACNWLIDDASRVWEIIQDDLYDMYKTYTDEYEPEVTCNEPACIRETADVIAISLRSMLDFEVSLTFHWQDPDDEHMITAYVEDGKPRGTSVDG